MATALLLFAAWAAAADAPAPLRRFAFIAGSNDGGESLVRLKYAESDAQAFAAVLQDLGGVKPRDMILVASPTLQRFEDGLQRVRQMVASPRQMDERRELVFYYSGHSDDDGLILGKDRVVWDDLRRQINAIPAEVKVAILDSCSSGSLTRAKGGRARPAFLFDASSDMTGHAYLTSASAEEAAQESDKIGSSFFTHFLISGLRGAADTAGDGTVTLNEAYSYAFQETLASTEKTQYGPQHPAYDINLSGSGDLVLTDLRASSAIVTVGEDVAGRMYFRDDQGNLAVELNKTAGQKTELGLEPGTYSVVLDSRNTRMATEVHVSGRKPVSITMASLHAISVDPATARGVETDRPARKPPVVPGAALGESLGAAIGKAVGSAVSAVIEAAGGGKHPSSRVPPESGTASDEPPAPVRETTARVPVDSGFQLTFLPDFSRGMFASHTQHTATVNVLVGSSGSSHGFEVGGLANFESEDVVGFQAAGLANAALGSLTGFQTAGLVNSVGGDARFFQSAGLVNVSGGLLGGQTAGLGNLSLGTTDGVQVGGLFNWSSGEARGAQIAGLVNLAGRGMNGVQVAGVANWGTIVHGPQISVVNISDTVTGAQVGVVNIARRVSGAQIGVLNIAEDVDGMPLGLVSLVRNGRHALDLWMDTDGMSYAALSMGAPRFYTVLSAGYMPGTASSSWSLGFGLGSRIGLGRLFIDYDLSLVSAWQAVVDWQQSPEGYLYPRLRAVIGVNLFDGFAVDAGVSVRALIPSLSTAVPGANDSQTVIQPELILGVHIG